jgi:fused signal recognition particle receptor
MFKKLKSKLKGALSVFSKKAEEEAEVVDEPVEVKEEKKKPVKVKEEKKVVEKVVKEKPKKEKLLEKVSEEEPDLEKVDKLIQEAKEEVADEVPTTFETGQMQYRPDLEKIKEVKEAPPKEEVVEQPKKKKFSLFKKKEKVEEKPIKEQQKEELKEKKSLFKKVKQSISTKTISAEKFEKLFWELEVVLMENNVSMEVVEQIKSDLQQELVDKPLPRDVGKKIQETLRDSLDAILTMEPVDLLARAKEKKPLIIAVFGINGTGKTTSIAKLTKFFQKNNLSVVLAACDTFRAAAIQQLEEHAQKLDVKIIKHDYGADAAAVAYDTVQYAQKNNVDVVLIDTAGRLHSNTNLMAELEKIIRVAKPDVKIFVGESITGNDCIEQAKKFNDLVEMDGAILTKADVDEIGGAPLSISYVIKKPIVFLGVGQEYKDLEVFDKEKVLDRLGL